MTNTVSFALGERVRHSQYGIGTIYLSDKQDIATFMVLFDNPDISAKYICFDGLNVSDLQSCY